MKRISTAAIALAATAALTSTHAGATTRLVCNAGAACPAGFAPNGGTMLDTLAEAAAKVQDGDTILIWPGTYNEAVVIRKNDVTVRGMDRYRVVLDGTVGGTHRTLGVGLQAGEEGAPPVRNSTFQNMSGRHYASHSFFWTNVDGYRGRWLTGSQNAGYGVYAFVSTGDANDPSEIRDSYGSGNADSGFYVGGCLPCNAVLDGVWSEKNALGYSGTNAGGNLFIQNSEWNNNVVGILPSTLPSEPAGPQRGAIIRNNLVHHNNDADVPATDLTGLGPLGTGIGIAGGWMNQIYGNEVYDNKNYGIALFWLETPSTSNQVFSNRLGGAQAIDLTDVGPGSANNCFSKNVRVGTAGSTTEPTSDPPMIQTVSSCENPVQGAQSASPLFIANVAGVTEPRSYRDPSDPDFAPKTPLSAEVTTDLRRKAVACMPNPCDGIADNAFCHGGLPVAGAKSPECAASL
jgi:hypothetical protein